MAILPRDWLPALSPPPPPPPPPPPIAVISKLHCAHCNRWLCRIAFSADGRWWAVDVPRRNCFDVRDRLWPGVVQTEQYAMRCNHCGYVNHIPPQRLRPPTRAL